MKRFLLLKLFLICLAGQAHAGYADSMARFRRAYVDELYPIIKEDTAYLRFFSVARSWVLPAKVVLLKDQPPFVMSTSSGTTKEARRFAMLVFNMKGVSCTLYAYQLRDKSGEWKEGNVFVPFRDVTSGISTYGGGRYIDMDLSQVRGGQMWLDFNKAYNPYCAYTSGYNCPIPPPENYIPFTVRAGEKYHESHFSK